MNHLLPHGLPHNLVLADGSHWVITAGDEEAAPIVSTLCGAMQLRVMNPSASSASVRRLLVLVDAHTLEARLAACYAQVSLQDDGSLVCVLRSFTHSDGLYIQLVALSSIFAHDAQTRGGVLLHGALAEQHGIGVILAAPGGTGKTTASNRLLAPWRSRCDDTTLVVRDSQGHYWAHPWPTWSRFLQAASGGTWDVQHAVPLKGVFFLSQAVEDRVESVGPGHAVSLLIACAEQTSQLMARGLSKEATRALRLERFNNLCALALVVPTHVLRISLAGAFWQEIDQTLEGRHRVLEGVVEAQRRYSHSQSDKQTISRNKRSRYVGQ